MLLNSDNKIYNLRINHLKEPFGIDIKGNNFSFLANELGPFKASILSNNKIIETREVKPEETFSFYFNDLLEYNTNYIFRVESSLNKAEINFETALKLESPFIKPKNKEIYSPIFIKDFSINKEITKARLYITGLGLYQAFINDKKVGNAYLTPGFNDYDYYLRYQTYDITNLLIKEKNIIEVHMGDGWYKGRFGIKNKGKIFGDEYKLCAHILINFIDKTVLNVLTDNSWKVKSSKEIINSIYDGEEIDYTLDDTPLEDVIEFKSNYNLIPDFGTLIVEKEILYPELYISPKGEQILDFKQNMVGFIRYKGKLNKNQELKITHGEILLNKCFYCGNLGTVKAIVKYKGDGKERIYEPKFTFFGFRYALIEGFDKINPKDFEGIVMYTDLETTIECKTDSEKINKLLKNTFWSQRGNFLDVPTDCPQRDERLGWTEDAQVFLNTASFNMDSYNFYKKYLYDLRSDQVLYFNGDIPMYSPSLKHEAYEGGAGWADSAIIIPWNLYMNYGDKQLLEYFYPMMKDYVSTLIKKDISQNNNHLILSGFTFGDWLSQDGICKESLMGGTDTGFIMSVYYYNSVKILSLTAKELNKNEDFEKYNKLKDEIYNSILDEFFTPNGKLAINTQTGYTLSLFYGIYRNKAHIIKDFKKKLRNDFYHIKTGFIGTPLILLCLLDEDMVEEAYNILYNEECPGWIYAINLGSTTIWERWNLLNKDGTLSSSDKNTNSNSFNHYAYGSVCEAIYSRIAGLKNLSPGWKKVLIKPKINYHMKKMEFSYESVSGKYEIFWRWVDKKFNLDVNIPFGAGAEIVLPNDEKYHVNEGKYHYECDIDKNIYAPFSVDTPLFEILKNQEATNIVKKFAPGIFELTKSDNEENKLNTIRNCFLPMDNASPEEIEKCQEELSKINPLSY